MRAQAGKRMNAFATQARRAGKRFGWRRAKIAVPAIAAALIVAVALAAPFVAPFDPYAQDLSQALLPPSAEHLAGTDRFGRDVLARVVAGSTVTVLSTLALATAVAALGTAVGVGAAWRGRAVDAVLMRVSDVFLAFPGLVFALAVAGALGGGMVGAALAVAAISWPKYARLARGLALAQKEEPFVAASRLVGCNGAQIVARHVLPNIAGPILVTAVLDVGVLLMEIAGLSFLGLGAQPPVAEWGSMMSDNRSLLQIAPWTVLAPGVAIFVVVAVFNLLGDALRDELDLQHRTRSQFEVGEGK